MRSIVERKESTGVLRMLSPTECVKDRLAGYYHWDDRQCLVQAVLVAQANQIDIEEVARWSKGEGKQALFKQIKHQLHIKT